MNLSDVSIIKLLPPNLANDKNVRMMCEAFDEELRRIIADIPGIAIIPNLVLKEITDHLLLDLLAWQFHCDFYDTNFPIDKKQEIILKSLDWHTRKGTPSVVEEIVSTVFSKAKVQEWFDYGGLPYRFRIGTEEEMPDEEARQNLVRAINSVKNTRSWLDSIATLYEFLESLVINEIALQTGKREDFENFYSTIIHDGTNYRDGSIARSSGSMAINDDLAISILPPPIEEQEIFVESLEYGKRYNYFRDGIRVRDNSITRIGDTLILLE